MSNKQIILGDLAKASQKQSVARSIFQSAASISAFISVLFFSIFSLASVEPSVRTPFDPNTRLPAIPTNALAPYSSTAEVAASVVMVLFGLIVLFFASRDAIKTKSVLPVAVALSGVFCVISEVFCDVLGCVFWPTSSTNHAFTILGRQMSWFPVCAWFGFGAVLTYICFAMMIRNVRNKFIWLSFLLAGAADIIFEEVMLNTPGLYVYYGHQPLILFLKFPWWWVLPNAAGLCCAAAIGYRYKNLLRGWKAIAMFVITPCAFQGMDMLVGMPAYIALNGNYSWLVTQTAGIATNILALFAQLMIMDCVLNRDPLDMEGVEHPAVIAGRRVSTSINAFDKVSVR